MGGSFPVPFIVLLLNEFADPMRLYPIKLAETALIQPWPEIGPVGFTAALFVPGLGASFDQFDFGLTP
jgi:hypothetical protein